MGFGLIFKRLREDVPISAQKLADKIGIKAERLRKWEEKDLTPRVEDVQKIETFFNMEIKEIMKLDSIKKFLKVPHETPADIKGKEIEYRQSSQDLAKEIGKLREWQLGVDATLSVLMAEIVPLVAKTSGRSNASVFSQMKKDIEAETAHRIISLNKKG